MKRQAAVWRLWGALAEAGGVGGIVQEEGAIRDSGQSLHSEDQLKGMVENARGGSEKWEDKQKNTASWKR